MFCRMTGIMGRRVQRNSLPGKAKEIRHLMLNGQTINF